MKEEPSDQLKGHRELENSTEYVLRQADAKDKKDWRVGSVISSR